MLGARKHLGLFGCKKAFFASGVLLHLGMKDTRMEVARSELLESVARPERTTKGFRSNEIPRLWREFVLPRKSARLTWENKSVHTKFV